MAEAARPSWSVDALILGLFPAISYYLAFLYERGYLLFYGIGHEFISLGLDNVVWFGVNLILFLSILWATFGPVYKAAIYVVGFVFAGWWVWVNLVMFWMLYYAAGWTIWSIMFLAAGLIAFAFIYLAPLFQLRHGSYMEILLTRWLAAPPNDLAERLSERIGTLPVLLLMTTIGLSPLIMGLGYVEAAGKRNYLKAEKEQSWLLIRSYGTRFLLAVTEGDAPTGDYMVVAGEYLNGTTLSPLTIDRLNVPQSG